MCDPLMFRFRQAHDLRYEYQRQIEYYDEEMATLGRQIYEEERTIWYAYADDLERSTRQTLAGREAARENLRNVQPDKPVPLEPILTTVRAWPEVVSCGYNLVSNNIEVVFKPVLLAGLATSLIPLRINDRGILRGQSVEIVHPHIRESDICMGQSQQAFEAAAANCDLLAILTIARQMILGHNRSSELNECWRNSVVQWWKQYALGKESYKDWDCHTVINPDATNPDGSTQVAYLEWIYEKSTQEILQLWEGSLERHRSHYDSDDEDADCYAHCEDCGDCISENDDYWNCSGLNRDGSCGGPYFCGVRHYREHMHEAHLAGVCEALNNEGTRSAHGYTNGTRFYPEDVWTDSVCSDCESYICDDCIEGHDEKYHSEPGEIPTPLPDQPSLVELEVKQPLIIDTVGLHYSRL